MQLIFFLLLIENITDWDVAKSVAAWQFSPQRAFQQQFQLSHSGWISKQSLIP